MKRKMKITIPVILLSLCLTGIKAPYAEASGYNSVRVAENGEADGIAADQDVAVDGALDGPEASDVPVTKPSTETSITIPDTKASVTQIGGTVAEATGKTVKTGDVLSSSRILAVLLIGVGALFLLFKRKNEREAAEE